MKTQTKRRANQAIVSVALFCTVMQPTYALNLATEPLFVANRIPPKAMLTLSKDQQLYKKAYNDYSDLDGDNVPETTYKHSITYYGYFDPKKCYAYANNRFEPTAVTTFAGSAYCDGANNPSTGRWSGNFLNWASMSRMDAVRKLLYGGLRSTDDVGLTVLERVYLPSDAHAWAKYYNGPDIAKLTPFDPPTSSDSPDFVSDKVRILKAQNQDTQLRLYDAPLSLASPGAQLRISVRDKPDEYVLATVRAVSRSGKQLVLDLRLNAAGIFLDFGNGSDKEVDKWTVTNLSKFGISLCNVTQADSGGKSQGNTNPPLLRVAQGNFALWNANEVRQCQWYEEQKDAQAGFGGVGSNGNLGVLSEIDAHAENPSQTAHGLGTGAAQGQYYVRVKACASEALRGTENCRDYNGNLKPVGLLQTYGESIHFGLMTGSYAKNISGGVLRKAVGAFSDEVDAATGQFTSLVGIVKTLDRMRIYGYDYASGTYRTAAGDNCDYQLTSLTENECTSWGNPMSEIYFEALRYFGAQPAGTGSDTTPATTPTPAYVYGTGSKDAALGLPLKSWTPPIDQANACARLNVLVFNASVSSNDDDLRTTLATDINGGNRQIRELTNTVGAAEALHGKNFFIGKMSGDTSDAAGFELCTSKTVTALGDVSGICPEGPTVGGSYLIAGLAHHARTNTIRPSTGPGALDPKGDPGALKVTSYGIQLATNTPQLEIPVPGSTTQKVVIQPIYRLHLPGNRFGGGALVDMKYVRQNVVSASRHTGKVYVNWEDSEQGGDYDQDMYGTIEWDIDSAAKTIKITTNAISASTANPQGFGYTISGTTQDGPHFHSGILGFNYTDTVIAQPANFAGCNNCQVASFGSGQRGAQSVTYALATAGAAGSLKDPLWYLAKYGGFDDRNRNGQLDSGEWDVQNNLTGAGTPDGVPDTYFLVTNPLGLEAALERAFRGIVQTGSGSSVATSSGSIRSGSAVYAARFSTGDWTGQLAAQMLKPDGTLGAEEWEASSKLPTPDKRVIVTYRNDLTQRKGVPFRWPANPASLGSNDIGLDLVLALSTRPDGTGTLDTLGDERLLYLRGDTSREGNALDSFRTRKSRLGDIVNSNPAFVPAVPNDAILDASYNTWRKQFIDNPRSPMLYVGANDGMVHGFDASVTGMTGAPNGGIERFAYVPSQTFRNLNQLTNPNYVHRYFVDGSPAAGDARVNNEWRTVLVGTLGSGGRGVYALDVSNPPEIPGTTAADSKTIESNVAAPKVLWEFNVGDDKPSVAAVLGGEKPFGLGYSFGQPLIRKMANGRWAAIVASGYNNNEVAPGLGVGDGKGYIYILFLDGPKGDSGRTWRWGVDYIRLSTPATANGAAPNGMAAPYAFDSDADGDVDYIYAGDLGGNLWKFDVSDANEGLWNSAGGSNRVALYAGGPTQPITTTPQVTRHPTGKGFIVNFGTGKYLEPSDPLPASGTPKFATQSFYGIWDKNDKKTISTQTVVTVNIASKREDQLFRQTLNVTTQNGTTYRYVTGADGAKAPDWTKHLGWFMDFPDSSTTGERSVFDAMIVSRRLIFTTLIPSGGSCDFGGSSFIMIVNPVTGGQFDAAVLDANGDGMLNTKDAVTTDGAFAVGVGSSVGMTTTPRSMTGAVAAGSTSRESTVLYNDGDGRVAGSGNRRGTLLVCGTGATCTNLMYGAGRDSGRATWREVVKK